MILTPDQRLRVFVSSTLGELAAEREAARRAIESLELVPVMFELGARPHAPRTLYRAYLEQSHVFVGIYWQRYGWTAPDMEISGLEDEYALSARLPRLVYVKDAAEREPGLGRLLERIEQESSFSYKPFRDAAELEQLVRRDLVTLLTERFAAGAPGRTAAVPAPTAALVDRAKELETLDAHLAATRLVTLTGPGGVGKTRLAIEAAHRLADRFESVFFVPLAAVEDERLAPAALAAALGVSPSGTESELDAVAASFGDHRALLVLDNFEQLAAAASLVSDLLSRCRHLTVLVTSRALLRLQGEHEIVVEPLGVPAEGGSDHVSQYDAVRLFVERARAVRPSFHVDDDNAPAVAEICARLDGLPLAIELAAARVKLLAPEQLLDRLARRLDLAAGRRDAPERHQTLRNTMQWSYDLLEPAEKELFVRLGVFAGRFTLEAAEAVAGGDVVDLLSSLIDKSLVRTDPRGPTPGFSLLRTVREFALELLDASDAAADARAAHAGYYLERAREAHAGLRGREQAVWSEELAAETDNLHAAFEWWLGHGDLDTLAEVGWSLWIFWAISGSYLREGRRLMDEVLSPPGELTDRGRARAVATRGCVAFWRGDYGESMPDLAEALDRFRALGEDEGTAYCVGISGVFELMLTQGESGEERVREALRLLDSRNDRWASAVIRNGLNWALETSRPLPPNDELYRDALADAQSLGAPHEIAMARGNVGRYHLFRGDAAAALPHLHEAFDEVVRMRHKGGLAYLLDALGEASLQLGDDERAVRLLAAADKVRAATGALAAPGPLERNRRNVETLKERLGEDGFAQAWAEGAANTLEAAVADARGVGGARSPQPT